MARGDTGPWRGFERSEQAMHAAAWGDHPDRALRPLAQGAPPRAPAQLRRPPPGRAGRRHRRTRDEEQPDPARVVPHRLGGRPAPSTGCRRSAPTSRGSAGCRSPTRTTPGTRRPPSCTGCPGRTSTCRPGHPGSDDAVREVLARKPAHWLGLLGRQLLQHGGRPGRLRPLAAHQRPDPRGQRQGARHERAHRRGLRPRARRRSRSAGWLADTDVVFTTDHGEMQGDFGLLYKGPYHTDALMRLPFVWRPAPLGRHRPDGVATRWARSTWRPRSAPSPAWTRRPGCRAAPCRAADGEPGRERALCEWDSQFPGYGMHLRSVYRDGWLCTVYEPSTAGQPNGLEEVWGDGVLRPVPGRLRAVGHRPGRRGHRHGRALQRRRRPAPVREPVGRPVAASPARRPGGRPLRQPAAEERHLKVMAPA